jgi:glycosyltransferase involved in cell wall biosynthesis
MRPCTVFQNHSLDAMSGPDDHVAPRLTGVAIAVVVPTRNSARTLRACLESIRAQRVACTLVVVDNHSTDETKAISAELADLVLEAGPERSAQRNRGAEATDAAIVGFIDSDMALSPEVVGDAAAAIRDGAASVIVPEVTVGEGYWARVRAYERTFYRGNDAIEGPRFFSRQTFDKVGGFDEAMTGPEDWDLALRTAGLGRRVRIGATITHDEGRVTYFDACRKKAYYAHGVALFLRKYRRLGVVHGAQRPWLRQPRALIQPLGLGLIVLKIGEVTAMATTLVFAFVGRLLPHPENGSAARHRPQGPP